MGFEVDEAWQFFHSNTVCLDSKNKAEIDFAYNFVCFCYLSFLSWQSLENYTNWAIILFLNDYIFCNHQFCRFIFPGEKLTFKGSKKKPIKLFDCF